VNCRFPTIANRFTLPAKALLVGVHNLLSGDSTSRTTSTNSTVSCPNRPHRTVLRSLISVPSPLFPSIPTHKSVLQQRQHPLVFLLQTATPSPSAILCQPCNRCKLSFTLVRRTAYHILVPQVSRRLPARYPWVRSSMNLSVCQVPKETRILGAMGCVPAFSLLVLPCNVELQRSTRHIMSARIHYTTSIPVDQPKDVVCLLHSASYSPIIQAVFLIPPERLSKRPSSPIDPTLGT
jgi:hypothetical protein